MIVDDHVVFDLVRKRVDSGEYLDEMFGLPGVNLEGGGAFRRTADGQMQRIYSRGSEEFRAASSAGQLAALPPLTPVSEGAVLQCEQALGSRLPTLLRRCYLEIGNGGFGPGSGLLPVPDDQYDRRPNLIQVYERERRYIQHRGPMADSLLPVCEWGCAIVSLIRFRDPSAQMGAIDPNPVSDDELDIGLFPQEFGFTEWMRRWAEGEPHQPLIVWDEITGRWRNSTDDEYALLDGP